jgi:hypothetical protein
MGSQAKFRVAVLGLVVSIFMIGTSVVLGFSHKNSASTYKKVGSTHQKTAASLAASPKVESAEASQPAKTDSQNLSQNSVTSPPVTASVPSAQPIVPAPILTPTPLQPNPNPVPTPPPPVTMPPVLTHVPPPYYITCPMSRSDMPYDPHPGMPYPYFYCPPPVYYLEGSL